MGKICLFVNLLLIAGCIASAQRKTDSLFHSYAFLKKTDSCEKSFLLNRFANVKIIPSNYCFIYTGFFCRKTNSIAKKR